LGLVIRVFRVVVRPRCGFEDWGLIGWVFGVADIDGDGCRCDDCGLFIRSAPWGEKHLGFIGHGYADVIQ
jgi:hypothetical protein